MQGDRGSRGFDGFLRATALTTIRDGNRTSGPIVWREGTDGEAGESYDDLATFVLGSVRSRNEARIDKMVVGGRNQRREDGDRILGKV